MAFLKRGESPSKKRRLYLLEIEMPSGMQCVKIGVASGNNSLERMMQVNRDIFMKFRYTAKIGIKRDREVDADVVFKYETMLHRFFRDHQYIPPRKFDGSTELFAVPLEDAVQAFEAVLEGYEPDFTYVLPEVDPADELPEYLQ